MKTDVNFIFIFLKYILCGLTHLSKVNFIIQPSAFLNPIVINNSIYNVQFENIFTHP